MTKQTRELPKFCDDLVDTLWHETSLRRVYIQKLIGDFISTNNLVRKAQDQIPPKNDEDIHTWRDYTPDMAYQKCLDAMLTPKDGTVWAKIEVKE
jgi:hypothetical protein